MVTVKIGFSVTDFHYTRLLFFASGIPMFFIHVICSQTSTSSNSPPCLSNLHPSQSCIHYVYSSYSCSFVLLMTFTVPSAIKCMLVIRNPMHPFFPHIHPDRMKKALTDP